MTMTAYGCYFFVLLPSSDRPSRKHMMMIPQNTHGPIAPRPVEIAGQSKTTSPNSTNIIRNLIIK